MFNANQKESTSSLKSDDVFSQEINLMEQLGLDCASELPTLLDNDEVMLNRVRQIKKQFHNVVGEIGTSGNEEDVDDIYDAQEHLAKSQHIQESVGIDQNEITPPENFSHVCGEIYRSSFPRTENFKFLKDRLKLKSILVLIPEDYPSENLSFMEEIGIQLFQVGMSGNKEPFVNIPSDILTKALEVVLNPENHPILIHCNRGKHRTGCLVGCIRKLQNWSLTMIFDEYRKFAFPKVRALDQQFIELYDDTEIIELAKHENWLPIEW